MPPLCIPPVAAPFWQGTLRRIRNQTPPLDQGRFKAWVLNVWMLIYYQNELARQLFPFGQVSYSQKARPPPIPGNAPDPVSQLGFANQGTPLGFPFLTKQEAALPTKRLGFRSQAQQQAEVLAGRGEKLQRGRKELQKQEGSRWAGSGGRSQFLSFGPWKVSFW